MHFLLDSLVYPPQNVHLDLKSEKNRKNIFFTKNSTPYSQKTDSYKKNQENRQKLCFRFNYFSIYMFLLAEMVMY